MARKKSQILLNRTELRRGTITEALTDKSRQRENFLTNFEDFEMDLELGPRRRKR